jgi:hypothetical protein
METGSNTTATATMISLAFGRLPASSSGLTNGMADETFYDCFAVIALAAGRLSMFRL